jgi:hypothetical protein
VSDVYTDATELAILASGRAPEWSDSPSPTVEPSNAASGVPLEGAVKTLVEVALREQTHRRTVRLGIVGVDLLSTYTVTIDGTAVAYNAAGAGAADLEDVVDGIAAAINANGTVNQLVSATAVDANDTTTSPRTKVLIRGLTGTAYAVNFTESGPGANPALSAVADYESAELRLWWLAGARVGSEASGRWVAPSGPVLVSRFGFLERYDTAGLDRCHAQVLNLLGHPADGVMVTYATPSVKVGPALSEED